jgi:hypothetical protein
MPILNDKKYESKFFFKCFIFLSKILQKLRIFLKWSLWMRHLRHNAIRSLESFLMFLGHGLNTGQICRDFKWLWQPFNFIIWKWGEIVQIWDHFQSLLCTVIWNLDYSVWFSGQGPQLKTQLQNIQFLDIFGIGMSGIQMLAVNVNDVCFSISDS